IPDDSETIRCHTMLETGGSVTGGLCPVPTHKDQVFMTVSTENGHVIAMDLTGNVQWRFQISDEILSEPVYDSVSGCVLIGTTGHRVHALCATDGTVMWTRHVNGSVLAKPVID